MPDPTENPLFRVACRVVVEGFIDVPAGGTRSAAKKARMILTTSKNPWSHVTQTQAPFIETGRRGTEVPAEKLS
jgi:hypothetical protein